VSVDLLVEYVFATHNIYVGLVESTVYHSVRDSDSEQWFYRFHVYKVGFIVNGGVHLGIHCHRTDFALKMPEVADQTVQLQVHLALVLGVSQASQMVADLPLQHKVFFIQHNDVEQLHLHPDAFHQNFGLGFVCNVAFAQVNNDVSYFRTSESDFCVLIAVKVYIALIDFSAELLIGRLVCFTWEFFGG